MAEQIQGVPTGLVEEQLPQAQPTQQVEGVPAGLQEEALPKAAPVAKAKPAPGLLDEMSESPVLTPTQKMVVGAAKGVRGLYHGVMGDEESEASRGATTTASPAAASLGFTPEHLGYEAGKMTRGVGQFIGEGVKDIAGKTPVVKPEEPGVSWADPKAHTLVAKYVTAPSQAERDAAQAEMQKYFETNGADAAGHA